MSFISSLEIGSEMKFWLLTAASVFSLHQSVKQQITRAGVGNNDGISLFDNNNIALRQPCLSHDSVVFCSACSADQVVFLNVG